MSWLRRGFLVIALAGWGLACGDPEPSLDCSGCTDGLCWYTTDFDGSLASSGCLDWPAACETDRSCACVNAETMAGEGCDTLGYVQDSNACSIDEDEGTVLYCVSTLG